MSKERKGKHVKYRHLWAWDLMMNSSEGWRRDNQRRAEEDDAPIDAVYFNETDGARKWRRFADVNSDATKKVVAGIIAGMSQP